MLLKLIPALSEPTIHFSLSFADLPPGLPTPPAWTAQLAQLMLEDLEVPATLHSLDKAVGVTGLLDEVELDNALGEVRCRFIDGKVESWGFWEGITSAGLFQDKTVYGRRLTHALESIVRDVNESTLEDERVARDKENQKERLAKSGSTPVSSIVSGTKSSGKVTRHKKQRSLLMQIVSCVGSIINLTGPSSPSSSRFNIPSISTTPQHHAYAVTHNKPTSSVTVSNRARALRRAARSALVDAFRLFVLSELLHRLPGPVLNDDPKMSVVVDSAYLQPYHRRDPLNFTVWVLHSIRRRALERMNRLLEDAEIEFRSRQTKSLICPSRPDPSKGLVATTMDVPLSFSDDEEDIVDQGMDATLVNAVPELVCQLEVDSDSDESSLRTPSSSSHHDAWSQVRSPSDALSTSSLDNPATSLELSLPAKTVNVPVIRSPVPPKGQVLSATPFVSVSPPTQHLSPAALHEYTDLLDLRTRLRQLLFFAASQSRVILEEKRTRLEVLAIKSRRRAWSNRALSMVARSQSGLGGQDACGLATTFRSSPLAKYMWTAEDLAKHPISTSSSPVSTISSRSSSLRSTYRPRLRPKIQYDLESLMMPEVSTEPFVSDNTAVQDEGSFEGPEFEIFEETKDSLSSTIKSPSRHRKVSTSPHSPKDKAPSIMGRLFPVNEDREGEVQDHYPKENKPELFGFPMSSVSDVGNDRTFMGCDEIQVYDGAEGEGSREVDIELGFGEFGARQLPTDIEPGTDMDSEVFKPAVRVRTTSMMGALLQRAKSSLHSPKDKDGRQPVLASVTNPTSIPVLVPKLQLQSQTRLKRSGSPPIESQAQKSLKISRSGPAIYSDIEVNMELDVQLRIGVMKELPPVIVASQDSEKTEPFTLSMDLPRSHGRKRRDKAHADYPTRPLSRHEFEEHRRPKLEDVFASSVTSP